MTQETRIINIEGMTCDGCVRSVHDTAGKLDGVISLTASLDEKRATVTYDSDKIAIQDIANAIEEAGFDANVANS